MKSKHISWEEYIRRRCIYLSCVQTRRVWWYLRNTETEQAETAPSECWWLSQEESYARLVGCPGVNAPLLVTMPH